MSYNVAVVIPPIPSNDKEAWQAIDALIDAKGEPPEVFKELHNRPTTKYPCICSLATMKSMMACGVMAHCGMILVIALPCWVWSIHAWKKFCRSW